MKQPLRRTLIGGTVLACCAVMVVPAHSRVQASLDEPASDVNGAVLHDGTIVRMPPREAYHFASLPAPGQMATIHGWALDTSHGRVVDVQAIGPASAQTTPPWAAPAAPPPPLPPGR